MRLKSHVPLLESTVKHIASRPVAPSLCTRCRRYASSSSYPEKIAIVGGGISGLASAYFVSKEFPKTKITVYEQRKSPGGWIQSRRVKVPGGSVLFESGPRTLRTGADAMVTAQLIQDLGLEDRVLYTKRDSVAAQNRFLYYPDRLTRIPSAPDFVAIFELARSGLLDGLVASLGEPWRAKRPDDLIDESIGSFISRRFDKRIANNLVSAVYHGIYAGDIWQLSARSLMGPLWMYEAAGSVWSGYQKLLAAQAGAQRPLSLYHPYDWDLILAMREEVRIHADFQKQLDESAMFTFKDGIEELIKAMQYNLEANKQVEFKFESYVQEHMPAQGGENQKQVVLKTVGSPSTEKYDLVVSSAPHPGLTYYVTVMTVNLYFPNPNLLPEKGFGYLIPQSVSFDKNPERALGVIFDSDAVIGQDTVSGTKLTVMLGGHHWDGWTQYPSGAEGYDLAMSVVRRHLKIQEEPTHHQVNFAKACIPQYRVGHEQRLRSTALAFMDRYQGRLRIANNQTYGVGVNDCIKGAWAMARGLRGAGWKGNGTGLERTLDDREWVFN